MRDVTDERRDAAALELGRQIDQWLLDDRPTLEVLERTCLRLLDGFDVDAAWIGLRRDDGEIDVLASAGDGTALDGIEVRWDGGPNASDPSGRAVRSGRPVLATPDDEGFVPWHRRVAASFTAALAVPVLHGGDVVAVLTVYSRFGVPFEPRSVDRFRHLCDRLSIVLDQVADVGRLPRRTAYPAAITRIGADHGGRADVCVVVVGRLTGLRRSAGFDVGEGALGTVARRVASAAPEGAEVVRTGDDEITVVCPPSPDLGALGSRLVDRLRDPVPVGADQLVLPVAVGCVRYEAGDDADVSLRRATAAAARGYEQEPFACVIADGELESAERDLATLQELRRAIHDGAIEVWWQPQIDTGSGKVIATEALARWRRADGSLSTPVEFLALAEDDGCIVDLGRQVLREAVRTGRRWHGLGVERVCVNASVRELAEPGYAEHVRGLLIEHGLPPEALEIELVETSLLGRRVADVLHALHRLGVRVAVDDYGTGWSSLSYLARFPFDTLKIDRAFVRDLAIDDRARALVDSTVALGRSLGIDVVAEGVEDVGHAEHLSSVGCHLLQGFAVSPPVPAEDLEPLLGAWRWHPDDDLVGSAVDGPARSVGGP
jgi:EAL domain-containing protein (putative c-di-GMP-specific phosphodiesterase class I)